MYAKQYEWSDVILALWPPDATQRMRIPKNQISHPLATKGMKPGIGLPEGQSNDYRLQLVPSNAGLHVKEFKNHYEAHIDKVHPAVNFVEHIRQDAPGMFVGTTAAMGALVGVAAGRSADAALVGALIGGLFGALAASIE